MTNWLLEFLTVLEVSKRTQWAIVLGVVFFFGIHIIGEIALRNFQLQGQYTALEEVLAHKLARHYDKVAFITLISFWVLAYKCYKKDKNKFWR